MRKSFMCLCLTQRQVSLCVVVSFSNVSKRIRISSKNIKILDIFSELDPHTMVD